MILTALSCLTYKEKQKWEGGRENQDKNRSATRTDAMASCNGKSRIHCEGFFIAYNLVPF